MPQRQYDYQDFKNAVGLCRRKKMRKVANQFQKILDSMSPGVFVSSTTLTQEQVNILDDVKEEATRQS